MLTLPLAGTTLWAAAWGVGLLAAGGPIGGAAAAAAAAAADGDEDGSGAGASSVGAGMLIAGPLQVL